MPPIWIGLTLAFASAVVTNTAYSLEHDAAARLPPLSPRRPFRSVQVLLRDRRWLVAFGAESAGWLMYVAALRLAPLALVQAVAASGVAVLAFRTARGHPSRLARREQVAVVLAIAGLVLLGLSLVDTAESDQHPAVIGIIIWLAACGGGAALLIAIPTRFGRAASLGLAAGLLFADGDISAKLIGYGGAWLLALITLIVAYTVGTSVLQWAYQRGDALTAAGTATMVTNAVPIAAGFVLFGESLPHGTRAVLQVAAFACLVMGAVALGHQQVPPAAASPAPRADSAEMGPGALPPIGRLPDPLPEANDHRLQARRDRQAPRHRGFVECAFMTATLTWSGVTARRMARHALAEPAADLGPAAVAALLCGAHAQVLSAAELSIGRRIAGATRTGVQHALWQERTLVKTFGPRGTVHLLAAADLPMWTGALSALPSPVPVHPEGVRFAPGQADEVIAAIGDALTEAELTVDELTEALADRPGPWAVERTMDAFQDKWPRWRQLTSTAAHRGVLCFGPDRGRMVTYTNPHRWLTGFRPADGETALRILVARYLHAYGPATPAHFARWIGIPPRHAAALFGGLSAELERVEQDGEPAWTRAGDSGTPAEPHRGVRLLPYFDPYVVAGQPRERLYPGAAASRALTPSGQAGNYPVLLVNGVVGGVWHQRRSGRKLALTVEPLRELTTRQRRELDDEAALVGAVMEATPTLTVGPVTVGPHA